MHVFLPQIYVRSSQTPADEQGILQHELHHLQIKNYNVNNSSNLSKLR